MEELPQQWKESVIVAIYKKGGKLDSSTYIEMSLFPTRYKILSNIFLSLLTPYTGKISGDHQCGF
jgi:hypothetical protein